MTDPALAVEDLACGFTPRAPVLSGVRLTVRAGGTVALVGPSGSGKTTLLRTIVGALPPLGGGLEVLGHRHPARPPAGAVGYIPQGLGLVRHASVLANVLTGTLRQGGRARGATGAFSAAQVERAREALGRVGLGHKLDARPAHLSGGERRRVAVARALAQRPALLLADEMLSELDARTAASVLGSVREMQGETGLALVLVEHDVEAACSVADTVCCIGGGRLVATLAPGPDRVDRAQETIDRCAPVPTP